MSGATARGYQDPDEVFPSEEAEAREARERAEAEAAAAELEALPPLLKFEPRGAYSGRPEVPSANALRGARFAELGADAVVLIERLARHVATTPPAPGESDWVLWARWALPGVEACSRQVCPRSQAEEAAYAAELAADRERMAREQRARNEKFLADARAWALGRLAQEEAARRRDIAEAEALGLLEPAAGKSK